MALNESKLNDLRNKGNSCYREGRLKEAETIYTEAIEMSIPDARLYHNRGQTRFKLGNYEGALDDVRRASEMDLSYIKAWILRARLLNQKFCNTQIAIQDNLEIETFQAFHHVLELQIQNEEAGSLLKSALDIKLRRITPSSNRDTSKSESELECLVNALRNFESINDPKLVKELLLSSINQLFEIQSVYGQEGSEELVSKIKATECKMYNSINGWSFKLGDYSLSISCCFVVYYLSLGISDNNTRLQLQNGALSNLQASYIGMKNPIVARKYINMALSLLSNQNSEEGIRLLLKLAETYSSELDYKKSIELYQKCIILSTQCGNLEISAKARVNMATNLCEIGNFEAALEASLKALAEYQQLGNVIGVAFALENAGTAQLGLKHCDDAIDYFQKSLQMNCSPIKLLEINNLIGNVYWEEGQKFEIQEKDSEAKAAYSKARNFFELARKQKDFINDEWRLLKVDTNLANVYRILYRNENETYTDQFFQQLIERAERVNFRGYREYLLGLSQFLFGQFKFHKTIEIGLKAQREFSNVIKRLKDEELILTRKERRFDKTCSKMLQLCYVFTKDYNAALLVAENMKDKNNYASAKSKNDGCTNLTLENICNIAILSKSALLIFSEIGRYLFCWLAIPIIGEQFKFIPFYYGIESTPYSQEKSKELEPLRLDELKLDFENRGSRTFQLSPQSENTEAPFDTTMFQKVWENIEEAVTQARTKRLVIIPDGRLYNTRFASTRTKDGSPLVNNFTILISPSISSVTGKTNIPVQVQNNEKCILIVSDPRENLPFAIEESKLVNRLYNQTGGWHINILNGPKASRDSVISERTKCKIFHIAAHANADIASDLQVLCGSLLLSSKSDKGVYLSLCFGNVCKCIFWSFFTAYFVIL